MEPAVEVPVVTAVAVPVTAVAQPMQVTVPEGIGPGMQFMVNIGGPPAIAGMGDPEFIAIMNEPGTWEGTSAGIVEGADALAGTGAEPCVGMWPTAC